MRRKLGRFELAQVLTDDHAPLNAVVVVGLESGPDPEAIRRSLAALQRRHLALSARVRNYTLECGEAPEIPLATQRRTGGDDWRRVVEEELGRRFDLATGPLLRLVYLRAGENGGRAELVLTFQHVVMDATSGARLVHELLASCAAPDAGGGEPRPLPPPIETRFPAPFRGPRRLLSLAAFAACQAAGELAHRWRMRGVALPSVDSGARNRIDAFQLSRDATRALVRRSRRERVSLGSALGAAMLLAVDRRLYGGRPLPARTIVFPNLRPYLVPPLADGDLASCFVLLRLAVAVDPSQDLWNLARRLNDATRRALRRGDKYSAALLAPWLMRASLRSARWRLAQTALSYSGRLELAPSYGATQVEELHAFVSNIPVGPEYTAQVRLADGCLWWDVVYLDKDLDRAAAAAVAAEVRSLLA